MTNLETQELTGHQADTFIEWFDKEIGTETEVNQNGMAFSVVCFELTSAEKAKCKRYLEKLVKTRGTITVAEYKRPKQRATRHYGYIVNENTSDIGNKARFSVHTKYYDNGGGYGEGHYDLEHAQAVNKFTQLIQKDMLSYTSECNE
jgi:hypothetical protein